MILYVQNILFQHVDSIRTLGSNNNIEQLQSDKAHTSALLRDINFRQKGSYSQKQSMMKNSVRSFHDGMLSPINEEEDEDRFFLDFMNKYYQDTLKN